MKKQHLRNGRSLRRYANIVKCKVFLHGLLNVLLLGGDELIAKLRAKGISVTVMSRAEADFVRRHDDM
jgi:hypothetical protein